MPTVDQFLADLAARIVNRPQINTDGFKAYQLAIRKHFGPDVDYAMIVKSFEDEDTKGQSSRSKYEAPRVKSIERKVISGTPDLELMSTSYIERHNATMRLLNKRMGRATLAFSKKLDNFVASVGLYMAYYNFCKTHGTLKATPAQACGLAKNRWGALDLVALSE